MEPLASVAYGGDIEAPQLFLQHTYLTIVAKAIATVALFDELPKSGAALLAGAPFKTLGVLGAVESDFFDWVLLAEGGDELVMNIARHANRFRLHNINADILKGLYESLIDPDQRHDLGEYYTPDWLAARICKAAITQPLEQRVIDPACGSGTFLFHAIRRALAVATKNKLPTKVAVSRVIEKIAGIDVHPVAIIFARTTYLLALLPALQEDRPSTLTVPVYLGDALQWNAREFMSMRDLEIVVPAQGEAAKRGRPTADDEDNDKRVILRFPSNLASEPGRFDAVLDEMLKLAETGAPVARLDGVLKAHGVVLGSDAAMIRGSYTALCTLQQQRRNHIWGYVARNLSRPIWLASEAQKADVVIGNPPWLAYSRMSPATQDRFREEMKSTGLWGWDADCFGLRPFGLFFCKGNLALHAKRWIDSLRVAVCSNVQEAVQEFPKWEVSGQQPRNRISICGRMGISLKRPASLSCSCMRSLRTTKYQTSEIAEDSAFL